MDQALNLVTRVSDPSYASRTSIPSADLDGMDVLDDLDVAADVATAQVDDTIAEPAVGAARMRRRVYRVTAFGLQSGALSHSSVRVMNTLPVPFACIAKGRHCRRRRRSR